MKDDDVVGRNSYKYRLCSTVFLYSFINTWKTSYDWESIQTFIRSVHYLKHLVSPFPCALLIWFRVWRSKCIYCWISAMHDSKPRTTDGQIYESRKDTSGHAVSDCRRSRSLLTLTISSRPNVNGHYKHTVPMMRYPTTENICEPKVNLSTRGLIWPSIFSFVE